MGGAVEGGVVDFSLGGAALAAAAVYWLRFAARDDRGVVGAVVKTASTALLAVLLWRASAGLPALWPMALGLSLGAVGDWCLAHPGQKGGQGAFLAGMAGFGAGHLAYAGGLLARSSDVGLDGLSAPEIAAALVLAGLVASTEGWLAPRTGALRWPVRAYVGLIGLMGLVLVLLPAHPGQSWLRLGGGLFILSDLLLALRLFVETDRGRQRVLSLVLWPAYWGGQFLLAWASVLYWLPEKG